MTKNKRFKSVEEKRAWGAVQYFTYNDGIMTHHEIEELVNQLLEENEQLKEKNKKNIQFVFEAIETYSADCFDHNEGGWSYMLNDLIEYLKDGMGLEE